MKALILASTSPRRREILAQTGLKFSVEAPDFEEDMAQSLPPAELAKVLSLGKAKSVADHHPGEAAVVIGSDTFICYRGQVIGKPHTPGQAIANLKSLSGHAHSVFTGYAIIDAQTGRAMSGAVETKVHFRPLADAEIVAYVATGEPLDRAGGYAIQGGGAAFVDHIEGDYDTIVGLPLAALIAALKDFGIEPA